MLEELLDEKDKKWIYRGEAENIYKKKVPNHLHEKGTKNNPLNEAQNAHDWEKSKIRARAEYIFGFIETA